MTSSSESRVPAEGGSPETVGILGGGLMGSGIAEVCARHGLDVVLVEQDTAGVDRARAAVSRSLDRAVRGGALDRPGAERLLGAIRFSDRLESLANRTLVVEAVAENEALKIDVFARLDAVVEDPDALLVSNTSAIPIIKLAMATSRQQNVVGVHFFNPVPVMALVEIVPTLVSGPEAERRAVAFAADLLGKTTIRSPDRAGFVVNALLVPYLLSAVRMLESGFASAADIDTGMVLGCGHPMGPLRLIDLIGLDTTAAVAESMYAEFKEPLYAPSPMLAQMVAAGRLGRKSGRGFFTYA
ncbi:3-hydroxybutyryl-CoA dehydrogenase [Pseudonocardia sp. GCM10023141]|uniref:3-hydroxybutyryl-CoA dehydrogenase n=1 Tax=Pseudonocardia sp. GCM10023141 TaxID=3252653 RepID=UPI003615B7F1